MHHVSSSGLESISPCTRFRQPRASPGSQVPYVFQVIKYAIISAIMYRVNELVNRWALAPGLYWAPQGARIVQLLPQFTQIECERGVYNTGGLYMGELSVQDRRSMHLSVLIAGPGLAPAGSRQRNGNGRKETETETDGRKRKPQRAFV